MDACVSHYAAGCLRGGGQLPLLVFEFELGASGPAGFEFRIWPKPGAAVAGAPDVGVGKQPKRVGGRMKERKEKKIKIGASCGASEKEKKIWLRVKVKKVNVGHLTSHVSAHSAAR